MEDCKGQRYVPVYHPRVNVCSYDFHEIVLRMMRKLDITPAVDSEDAGKSPLRALKRWVEGAEDRRPHLYHGHGADTRAAHEDVGIDVNQIGDSLRSLSSSLSLVKEVVA